MSFPEIVRRITSTLCLGSTPFLSTKSVLFLCVGIVLFLAACDVVNPRESVVLQKQVAFRFEFSSSAEQVGEPIDVTSTERRRLEDILFDEGFSPGEVILVNVRSVEVQRVQPVGTNLDAFDRIDLTLTAGGLDAPVIATSEDLPTSQSALLRLVVPGVTEVVTSNEFGARLTAVPRIAEDFVLRATIDLRIEAEGV